MVLLHYSFIALTMRYSELQEQVQSLKIIVNNGTATVGELTMVVNELANTASEYTNNV